MCPSYDRRVSLVRQPAKSSGVIPFSPQVRLSPSLSRGGARGILSGAKPVCEFYFVVLQTLQKAGDLITKQTIKDIRALGQKKGRDASGLFIAEGAKAVCDLLPLLTCERLCATADFLASADEQLLGRAAQVDEISRATLERLSLLRTPQDVVAVFRKPLAEANEAVLAQYACKHLCLALDDVQDPGNLGTIIRLADWFGIEHVFLSQGTADAFAPKVVQATMGAIGRVGLHRVDLPRFLQRASGEDGTAVYGTFLDGADIYAQPLGQSGIIVMGNEGNGISSAVEASVTQRLRIPSFPPGRATSESLNVATATAVVCAEFRRRQLSER